MGERIQSICRPSDVVARLGGDEFLVIAESFDTLDPAEVFGQRLLSAFATAVRVGDKKPSVGVSIGAPRCTRATAPTRLASLGPSETLSA